jgi:hypothetical protein
MFTHVNERANPPTFSGACLTQKDVAELQKQLDKLRAEEEAMNDINGGGPEDPSQHAN